jgi:hypothetical protein
MVKVESRTVVCPTIRMEYSSYSNSVAILRRNVVVKAATFKDGNGPSLLMKFGEYLKHFNDY